MKGYIFAGVALVALTIIALVNGAGKNSHSVANTGNQATTATYRGGPKTNLVLITSSKVELTDNPFEINLVDIDPRDGTKGLYVLSCILQSKDETCLVWDPEGHGKLAKPKPFGKVGKKTQHMQVDDMRIEKLDFAQFNHPVTLNYQLWAYR